MTRQEAAALIVDALRERTGIDYTVTRAVGIDGDVLVIDIAEERRSLPSAKSERHRLASLLGLAQRAECLCVPDSEAGRREYVARARGVDGQNAEPECEFEVLPLAADPIPER